MATAVVLLWTEIGGVVGNAISQDKFDVSGVEAHSARTAGGIRGDLRLDTWSLCKVLAFPGRSNAHRAVWLDLPCRRISFGRTRPTARSG